MYSPFTIKTNDLSFKSFGSKNKYQKNILRIVIREAEQPLHSIYKLKPRKPAGRKEN